ncbi:hypothetical protein [Nostoc sp. C052]|uniref:hypothetical protein n=1 Tax=Nostoc sp. C052 TaxID=2576902 RepID=UPI0015C3D848|nr:hypothetical protein [Nostoc sp. C052]
MTQRYRVSIEVSDIKEQIERIADAENRPFSNMCQTLLHEALAARNLVSAITESSDEERVTLPQIQKWLPKIGAMGLAQLIKSAIDLLLRKILQSQKNPVVQFVEFWDIEKLSEVSGISAPRLQEIKKGSPISGDEATGLVHAGMNPADLQPKNVKKGEQNGIH